MNLYLKILIAAGVLVAARLILAPSPQEGGLAMANDIETLTNTRADESVSPKALHLVFASGNNYTIVQRNMKERRVTGKVVEWRQAVREVDQRGPNRFRVQTSATDASLGAFVTLNTRSAAEATYVEGLEPGDEFLFRGRIGGITKRHVDVESAVLVDPPTYRGHSSGSEALQ